MTEEDRYDKFSAKMAEKYPRYFGEDKRYGGFAIGEGWYHIIEELVRQINDYTKWKRNTRAYQLRMDRARDKGLGAVLAFICRDKTPTDWDIERAETIMATPHEIIPAVQWISVEQIKEKFGGLRFYYSGGDDEISGMVRMAEIWAGHTCETCGNLGKQRSGGWIRTLCDQHEAEYQEKIKNYRSEDE